MTNNGHASSPASSLHLVAGLLEAASHFDGESGGELRPGVDELLPVGTLEDGLPLASDKRDAGLEGVEGAH